jgi:hypothetical protein
LNTTANFARKSLTIKSIVINAKKLGDIALKVLSSKMDPAKIRFNRKVFIKERGAEVFRKIPVLHLVRALLSYSATSYSCWLFGNKLPKNRDVGVRSAVANIAEEFIVPLPISRSVRCVVAHRE